MARNLGKGGRGGKIAVLCALVPFSTLFPPRPSVAAWSADGHRVVCRLAWDRLTAEARAGVRALLGADLDAEDFADECTWADRVRVRLDQPGDSLARFRPFTTAHYVNFPRGAAHLGRGGCTEYSQGRIRYCAIDGVDYLTHVLEGGDAELSRGEALRFLIHIVGDLHQPLHAGYGDDRGGNGARVNVMGREDRDLHWVWDVFMVGHGGESWEAMAARLEVSIPPVAEERWRDDDPLAWAAESYEIVEMQVYRDVEDGGYVGQDYYMRNRHTAERRLQLAGIRLAHRLNRVFDRGN